MAMPSPELNPDAGLGRYGEAGSTPSMGKMKGMSMDGGMR